VDMEVAYGLPVRDRTLAVAAVSVRDGFRLEPKDVTEALRALDPRQRPDLVYVVDDIPRSASYRPSTRAVQAAGRPQPGPGTWWYDAGTESYEVLTETAARELLG
ncbi:acyl-CoA synthetase, partial [Nocardia cyriacigeorgica]|nr:acyl-CoA synthetase [Nocardia cyriacigeorgica]